MSYKIIVDSCCELPDEFKKEVCCEIVPLGIDVDDCSIIDDDTFDQPDFLRRVAASVRGPRSQCPSPDSYFRAIDCDAERIYIITLSAALSGSYDSASLAARLYHEDRDENKRIYVFNSRSASCGETQIAYWIKELEDKGTPFDVLTKQTERLINSRKTFFVLENLETLRKAGRLGNIKSFIASALDIKPIMSGTIDGTIAQQGQARGIKRALSKMIDMTLKNTRTEDRTLMISHCNCPERADFVLKEYLSRARFKDTLILATRGISSMYANDGGIIVTF